MTLRSARRSTPSHPLTTLVAATLLAAPLAGVTLSSAAAATPSPCPGQISPPLDTALVANYVGSTVQALTSDGQTGAEHSPGSGTKPSAVAITPDGKTAWLADRGTHSVDPYNLTDGTFGTRVSLGSGSSPLGVAITPDGNTLWAVDSAGNQLVPVSLTGTNANLAGSPIDLGNNAHPDGVAVSTDGNQVFVAEFGSGAIRSVPTPQAPASIAGGTIALPSGAEPSSLAVTPDGSTLWVTDYAHSTVTPIATNGLAVGAPVQLAAGSDPTAIAISPDGSRAYVADSAQDAVSVLDLTGGSGITPGSATAEPDVELATGSRPEAVAVSPDGATALVADFGSNDVVPLDTTGTSVVPGNPISVGSGSSGGAPDAIVYKPVQAPVAALTAPSAAAGNPVTLDASSSTGTRRLTYSFDFGDGSPVTAASTCPTVSHTYASPGDYPAKVTVTDGYGTSTAQTFTGQTVSRQGASTATTSVAVRVTARSASNPPRLVVSAAGDKDVVAVPASGAASSGIATAAAPGASAISPDGNTDFVVLPGAGELQAVNLGLAKAGAPLAVCTDPESVGVTPDGGTVAVACGTGNSLVTYSTAQGRIVRTSAIGGTPSGLAITTDGSTAWVTQASADTMTSVALGTGAIGQTLTLPAGSAPSAAAVTPDGRTLLVTEAGSHALAVVDLTASPATVRATVGLPTGADPTALAVTPDGSTAWIADTGTASLSAVTLTGQPTLSTSVLLTRGSAPAHPVAVTVTPDGQTVYAADDQASTLDPVSPASSPKAATAGSPVKTGTAPVDVVATPDSAPQASLDAFSTTSSTPVEGSPVQFDASASTAPSTPVVSYAFAFGDGATAGPQSAATATHTYALPGTYAATVTEVDADGTSTTPVFTGRTLSLAGDSADAVATAPVTVAQLAPTVAGVDPAVGVRGGGQTVTVTGTDLEGATAVTFGGTPATAASVAPDGRSLTVLTPAATAATTGTTDADGDLVVDVAVTTPGGTSDIGAADEFTFTTGVIPVVTGISPVTGVAGSSVTVSGTGLDGATQVRFGAVAATGVAVDPGGTSLTATVPAGTGLVDVTVVTPTGGQSATGTADSFTYAAPPVTPPAPPVVTAPAPVPVAPVPTSPGPVVPAPVVTSLRPDPAVATAGSTLVVRGNFLTPATAVLFGTVPGTAVRVVPDGTSLLVTVPAGSGSVDVRVVAPTGTSAVTPADVFTYGAELTTATAVGSTGVAVLSSQVLHPTSVSLRSVVIAPDDRPEIESPASVLAARRGVSLLLTHRGSLDAASFAELKRVLKAKAPVLAVGFSPYDLGRLRKQVGAAGHPLQQIGTPDVTTTSLAVASALGRPRTVVVADISNADAELIATAVAIRQHAALVITIRDVVPGAAVSYVGRANTVYAVGYSSRSPRLGATVLRARRLAGRDAPSLSVAAANALTPHTHLVVLASASDVSGALAGLTLATARGATLLLTPSRSLPGVVSAFLVKHGAPGRGITTIGHDRAITTSTLTSARAAWSR